MRCGKMRCGNIWRCGGAINHRNSFSDKSVLFHGNNGATIRLFWEDAPKTDYVQIEFEIEAISGVGKFHVERPKGVDNNNEQGASLLMQTLSQIGFENLRTLFGLEEETVYPGESKLKSTVYQKMLNVYDNPSEETSQELYDYLMGLLPADPEKNTKSESKKNVRSETIPSYVILEDWYLPEFKAFVDGLGSELDEYWQACLDGKWCDGGIPVTLKGKSVGIMGGNLDLETETIDEARLTFMEIKNSIAYIVDKLHNPEYSGEYSAAITTEPTAIISASQVYDVDGSDSKIVHIGNIYGNEDYPISTSFRRETSDESIATVDKYGNIYNVANGYCMLYFYTDNCIAGSVVLHCTPER